MTRGVLATWLVGGLAVGTLFASLGWGLLHAAQKQPSSLVGTQVPDITIRSLDGDLISLRALKGTPLVINFWASWCVPCRQEAPALAAAAERTSGKAQFVGVDIQDTDSAARAYETDVKSPIRSGPPFTARITTSGSPPHPRRISSIATGLFKAGSSGRLMRSSWTSTWRRFSASDPGLRAHMPSQTSLAIQFSPRATKPTTSKPRTIAGERLRCTARLVTSTYRPYTTSATVATNNNGPSG